MTEIIPSGYVDPNAPNANMYGCQPCPKCRSEYRFPRAGGTVQCDDCGFSERIEKGSKL